MSLYYSDENICAINSPHKTFGVSARLIDHRIHARDENLRKDDDTVTQRDKTHFKECIGRMYVNDVKNMVWINPVTALGRHPIVTWLFAVKVCRLVL